MNPAILFLGIVCMIIIIGSYIAAANKGAVRCNKCGYVGKLKPKHTNIAALGDQKLVCPNCGSENYTEMKTIHEESLREDQRRTQVADGTLCPKCQRRLEPGTMFCPHDGTPICRPCASCGSANTPSASFCSKCGEKL